MTFRAVAPMPVLWMIGGSVATCLAALMATGFTAIPELVLGMAGPLASAVATSFVRERTFASAPERLGSVMIVAFAIKMLFFGAYVVVMLAAVALRPKPFMLSFTGYYVALHFVEALLLKRQLAGLRSAG